MANLNQYSRAALEAAIEEDHPCNDYGCDIHVAAREGHTEVAAMLLDGATECPNVNRVMRQYELSYPSVSGPRFTRWVKYHREHGRECPSCESFMYPNDSGNIPGSCSNCGASMTEEDTDE